MPRTTCNLTGLCGAGLPINELKTALEQPVLAPFAVVTVVGEDGVAAAQAATTTVLGLSPILLATIQGISVNSANQTTIYVGNLSNPSVIKSVNVGGSNGCGANIEIVDQEGGDFVKIFEKISRGGISDTYSISLIFGWVNTDCTGEVGAVDASEELTYVISNITLNYNANGALKFTVECVDAMTDLVDSKVQRVFGTNENPMYMTVAIEELLLQRKLGVEFVHLPAPTGGQPEPINNFKYDGAGTPALGPLRVWEGKNRNVLSVIREWLLRVTVDDKGLVVRYKADTKNGKYKGLISISNDTSPACDAEFDSIQSGDNIGTYIVNGGNCSPVISFQPNIKWIVGPAYVPGNTAGANNPLTVNLPGPGCDPKQNPQFNPPQTPDIATGWLSAATGTIHDAKANPNGANQTLQQNMLLHSLANLAFSPVQADLKIQGDPSYAHSIAWFGQYVTIILINPFQVDSKTCQWTNSIGNSQGCNQVLSNSNWLIQGVNHDIRDGSFTTTLKVSLPAPGIVTPFLAPL